MKLVETRVEHSSSSVRLLGVVERVEAPPIELFFAYPAEYAGFVRDCADPFVPALLVPSLQNAEDLEIVPPISPRLLRRLRRAQDILLAWHAPFRSIRVTARERGAEPPQSGSAVGALFSLGVDSFYTLLKSLRGWPLDTPAVSHLIYLRGLETPLDKAQGLDATQRRIRQVADAVGKPLIVGETNLRTCFPLNYELYYHGAALASAALALCGGLRYLLVPSSNSYAQLRPWGSHPLLDELWSTEALEVVHDGAEARRVDKLANLVAREPLALEHLRVCLENGGGDYNCGRCRKCVRTMTALDLLGVLPLARTFPDRLPDESEQLLRREAEESEKRVNELLDLARRTGRSPELRSLLERVARRRRRRSAIRTLLENTPLLEGVLPLMRLTRAHLRRSATRAREVRLA